MQYMTFKVPVSFEEEKVHDLMSAGISGLEGIDSSKIVFEELTYYNADI